MRPGDTVVLDGECSLINRLDGDCQMVLRVRDVDPFPGPYSYTPAAEAQTIPIAGKTATYDITVEPIPSNYGLITWNGSVLTVS